VQEERESGADDSEGEEGSAAVAAAEVHATVRVPVRVVLQPEDALLRLARTALECGMMDRVARM
jgi:hypothetical protein